MASGRIWSLWHLPLILAGVYLAGSQVVLSALIFVCTCKAVAALAGRVRLSSGSVWPAVVLHANWNAVIQGNFDRFTGGACATTWVGESGLLVALVTLGLALLLTRGACFMYRRPPAAGQDGPPVRIAQP